MRVCVCVRSSLAHGKSRLMKHLVSSGAMGEAHLATKGPYLSERAQNNAHHHHPPVETPDSPPPPPPPHPHRSPRCSVSLCSRASPPDSSGL